MIYWLRVRIKFWPLCMPMADTGLLTGLNLLITRPQLQAETWAQQLAEFGVNTDIVPVMAIEPLTDAASVQSIKSTLYDLDLYTAAIFVSQNAVQHGMDWVDSLWPQYPVKQAYFAVGSATAQALLARGVDATAAADAMNSEALLALPQLQEVAGERILILRGRGGRNHLGEELAARGARVDYVELYQRNLPVNAAEKLNLWLRKQTSPSLISVHSGESLDNLNHLATGGLETLKHIPLLVPGQRVAKHAKNQGWQVVEAENATHPAMLSAMQHWFQQNQ